MKDKMTDVFSLFSMSIVFLCLMASNGVCFSTIYNDKLDVLVVSYYDVVRSKMPESIASDDRAKYNYIDIIDLRSNDNKRLIFENIVSNPKLNRNGYLAVSVAEYDTDSDGIPVYSMAIFKRSGEKIISFDNVLLNNNSAYFEWSLDGDHIAFSRGKLTRSEYNSSLDKNYTDTGLWIYNIQTNKSTKLFMKGYPKWFNNGNDVGIGVSTDLLTKYTYNLASGKSKTIDNIDLSIHTPDGKHAIDVFVKSLPEGFEYPLPEYYIVEVGSNRKIVA